MLLETQEELFKGTSICQGVAIGRLYVLDVEDQQVPEINLLDREIETEIGRYRRALERSREDLLGLQERLQQEHLLDGAAILDTHLQIMQDPLLTSTIEFGIREKQKNAEFVFQQTIRECETKFDAIDDPFFKERGRDVQEIARRVMCYLKETDTISLKEVPNQSIIIAPDIAASTVAEAEHQVVKAFVTEKGGATSHAAIMARAKGIPYLSAVDIAALKEFHGQLAIVDTLSGKLIINPVPETLKYYQGYEQKLIQESKSLEHLGKLTTETYDGYPVKVSANIDVDLELDKFHEYGGHGVGLFRSEYIFLSFKRFPTEEEQYSMYRDLVAKMRDLPVVIRTFDLGGDKEFIESPVNENGDPIITGRAIRFMLKEKTILKNQLKAIIRAGESGNVSVMFPMISGMSELLEAKRQLREAYEELEAQGIKILKKVRVGCMIEVPTAAVMADLIAKECDFLSIGTNDLVQYSLAIDRTNDSTSGFDSPTHPGIIRLIRMIVIEANRQGIPVCVCGELAADPRFTPLLLGLGVHELSVAPRFIPIIKDKIRRTSIVDASRLADKVLALATSEEIEELLI